MDFRVPEEVIELTSRIRGFLDDAVLPLEPRLAEGFTALEPALEALRERVRAEGLWAPPLPPEWGGLGLGLTEFAHVSEVLGRSLLGHYVFGCAAPDIGTMELLLHFGSDEQKETWLRPLAAGRIRSCFSMTEPDRPGSNPTWLGTTARRDGDHYVIDGDKWFTTGADGAAFAVVMAVTDPDAESPHLRASQIIVPTDTDGFELVRNTSVMGHSGEGWLSHAEIRYRGVRVPVSNRIGGEGAGFALAQERLGPGRIHHCMRWIGICERAFELMVDYAVTREVAPGKPLGTRQMVQQWIAESRAEINAARLLVLQCAWKIDQEGAYAAREEISVIKFHAAGVLQRVLDRAIQTHGGLGLTDRLPLASWWRFERAARIYDGADEVHKAAVARRALRRAGLDPR